MDERNSPPVVSPEEMAGRFHGELIGAMPEWKQRLGKLPAGKELEGKRISVQIDGGRARIRGDLRPAAAEAEKTDEEGLLIENAPGRSKKRSATDV